MITTTAIATDAEVTAALVRGLESGTFLTLPQWHAATVAADEATAHAVNATVDYMMTTPHYAPTYAGRAGLAAYVAMVDMDLIDA